MDSDKSIEDSYYTRTLVRLYSYTIMKMQALKIPLNIQMLYLQ